MNRRPLRLAGPTLCLPVALAACDQTMFQQHRYNYEAPAPLFSNDSEAQLPPDHTVAQGALADDQIAANPPPATPALLARGQEQFQIYCTPCHGQRGDGDGAIVARGFPRPPDYASVRVRSLTGTQIYNVITHGYGVMFPYGSRVTPGDRWAIVAYVRALEVARDLGETPARSLPVGAYGGPR